MVKLLFFFVALEFELRASRFLGRHSITWAPLPVLIVKFKCSFILLYLFPLPIPGIILDLILRLSYFFSAYANSFLKHIYHLLVYIDLLSCCTTAGDVFLYSLFIHTCNLFQYYSLSIIPFLFSHLLIHTLLKQSKYYNHIMSLSPCVCVSIR
jgi:hypothetical protein